MRDLDGLIDTVSVWIDFNIDSSAMALLVVAVIFVASGGDLPAAPPYLAAQ